MITCYMSGIAQMTRNPNVCSTTFLGNTIENQCSALLAFVIGIKRWPVDSPDKEPIMRKTFPFPDIDNEFPSKCCLRFLNEKISTLIQISLKFVGVQLTLSQHLAWEKFPLGPKNDDELSQPSLLMHICLTRSRRASQPFYCFIFYQGPLLLTWFIFNTSMDR